MPPTVARSDKAQIKNFFTAVLCRACLPVPMAFHTETGSRPPSARRRWFLPLLAALLPLLFVAACSSGGGSEVASLSGGSTAGEDQAAADSGDLDPEEQQLRFARCMRDNGVDMPDPQSGGGFGPPSGGGNFNPRDENFRKAAEACQEYRPSGGFADRSFDEEAQQAQIELAQCMRENGIDMPDPQFDANGQRQFDGDGPGRGLNFQDEKFRQALETCREQVGEDALPGPGGPGAPGGSAGGDA